MLLLNHIYNHLFILMIFVQLRFRFVLRKSPQLKRCLHFLYQTYRDATHLHMPLANLIIRTMVIVTLTAMVLVLGQPTAIKSR